MEERFKECVCRCALSFGLNPLMSCTRVDEHTPSLSWLRVARISCKGVCFTQQDDSTATTADRLTVLDVHQRCTSKALPRLHLDETEPHVCGACSVRVGDPCSVCGAVFSHTGRRERRLQSFCRPTLISSIQQVHRGCNVLAVTSGQNLEMQEHEPGYRCCLLCSQGPGIFPLLKLSVTWV